MIINLVNFYHEGANETEEKKRAVKEGQSSKISDNEINNLKDIILVPLSL